MSPSGPPQGRAAPTRFYLLCFFLGVLAFLAGLVMDLWTGVPGLIPAYTAASMILVQVLLGIVFSVTAAVAAGRTSFMTMWHATLWALTGLSLSLVGWWLGVALAA